MTADSAGPSHVIGRRSPLADHREALAEVSGDAVTLAEIGFLSMVSLRVDPTSTAAARIGAVLGGPLPGAGFSGSGSDNAADRTALWLGPDEWLVIAPDGDGDALAALLNHALAHDGTPGRGSVVDVSANRTTLTVSGPRARDLLEKGMTIDLHPRAFGPGRCTSTTLARTGVVLWQTAPDVFRLLVRPSFAAYLAAWLIDAAQEYQG